MLTRVRTTVHLRYPCGTRLASRPPSAGRVHARPHGPMHATAVGDVVERAPHKAVTSLACRSRRLLVAQQVTATAGAGRDKAIKDLIAL